jgi:predicted RND superfamily exporter protein
MPLDGKAHLGERLAVVAGAVARACAIRWRVVLPLSWALALVAGLVASKLSVYGAFQDLLPPNAEAVRHLKELEGRTRVLADYMIGVESNDPEKRAAAALALRARLDAIDPDLVAGITADRRVEHAFGWEHRWLYAPLAELESARDALNREMIKANPLVEDLEEDPPKDARGGSAKAPSFAKLEDRLEKAKKDADDPGTFVSKDGHLQLIIVRTTFTSDDTTRGNKLTGLLTDANAATVREFPGVTVGMTGDVITSNAEHDSLLKGMVASTTATIVLVVVALLLFYRSVLGVGALCWALTVGVLTTFAYSWLTVGHLNIASAFLSSIVIGNGINFGLVYLARYLEKAREGYVGVDAIGEAAAASAPGTLAAALTATVAYGSLVITPFRGFRDFGIIGAAGMMFCWLATYTILPAGLAWVGPRVGGLSPARFGALLARVVPGNPRFVAALGVGLFLFTTVATIRYLTHDPLEDDLRNLTSDTPGLADSHRWMHKFDVAFGGGISGGFAIGVEKREEAPALVAKLKAMDANRPVEKHLFSHIDSLDDVLPSDQAEKLAILTEIRSDLDSHALTHLSEDEQKRAQEMRPPDDLRPIIDSDVPNELAWPFTERDGSRGKLILANTGLGVDSWSVCSLERFAHEIRALRLGPDVVIGGSAFVFSDMIEAMKRDGPTATAASVLGSALVVVLLLGVGRYARVTLMCAALGTTAMLSAGWLMNIKVNVLDFIALPITVGIGVDYAVNIAARARSYDAESRAGAGRAAMIATGPAVSLCSYTTVVGYASLLFSQNRGIHTFGLSAMIGELTCVTSAVFLAPALLDWKRADALEGAAPSVASP